MSHRSIYTPLTVAYYASQDGQGGSSHVSVKHGGTTIMLSVNQVTTADDEQYANLFAQSPKVLASLEELSEWMRTHTGPSDGTEEMLTRAVEQIQQAGGTIR